MSDHLMQTAMELAKAANQAADEHLPGRLAGIVKLHAGLSVGAGLMPVPGVDIALATANIWTMYIRINSELNLPFSENVAKSLAAAVGTNLAANAAAFLIGATLLKFTIIGTAGGMAIMAATIFAITIAAGFVYMKAITALLKNKRAEDIDEADLKKAADTVMSDKRAMKDIMRKARKDYKPTE